MQAERRARLARDPDAHSHCLKHLLTLATPLRSPSPTLTHIRRSAASWRSQFRRITQHFMWSWTECSPLLAQNTRKGNPSVMAQVV